MVEKTAANQIWEIGLKVKKYREKRHWSQKKLADMVSVSSSCITRLERGETMVSIFTLISIAAALQVPLTTLLYENSEVDLYEFENLRKKMARCSQKQRMTLIHSFEEIVDSFFIDS